MISIEKIKKKYHFDTEEFTPILENYFKYTSTINNPNYAPHLAEIHFNRLIDYFIDIIEISVKEFRIKDDYELYYTDKNQIIPKIGFVSADFEFTIGLFREIYIIWEIKNPDNIKNLKDDFWNLLFEFTSLGKFEYKEKNVNISDLRKKHSSLFSKRAHFFKLFRNYFLTQSEYKRTDELGFLHLGWNTETNVEEWVLNLINAIGVVYKLNSTLTKK
ncbi:hypothetical protein [Chryseobacterium rhizosphaerae]|uniref:hypothetical protein n=1 Tax=Chryseobacterium rhizosphaerae TaxID=395937 RepID=UPI00235896AD|nr:hypothetical protein [Chryseobacterium rhizosphaerae]MDC8099158.1 hypothetical protein [Chryseobacterium rhizosphaerae]